MSETGADAEDVREVRLEGVGLVLVAAVLVAALAGAFQLGRWFERRDDGPVAASGATFDELIESGTTATGSRTEEELSAFDVVANDAALEPGREARPKNAPTAGAERADTDTAETAAPAPGRYWVQVVAVRDRASAESVVGKLRDLGYGVQLDAEGASGDTIYRVRVGGFTSREDAAPAIAKLKADGFRDPFVREIL